jgi:putative ABC transport system permease protein
MDSLRQDLRRTRRPAWPSVAVLTIAVVIGANAAMWGAVHALLRASVLDPNRIAWSRNPGSSAPGTPGAVPAVPERAGLLGDIGTSTLCSLGGSGGPESVVAYRFSGNFFGILGVPARLGRTIGPEDARPGHEKVVVLADSLWRRRFASDPGVIGRAITIDGDNYTVVGVMPPGFAHPPRVELWTPLVREGAAWTYGPRVARLEPSAATPGYE